ncbi:class I SAM-dependent methyltransferase [Alicyclobacillus fastidiosus]|uniref:Class I SAM-dependent methyltransferase n=1 Tax=Alicyclobacillus fastidiosus TaxID=392011 RepID=A0ABY6ZPD6_9BACL|nr:class I SAM-dependent methyltransferase [Alicyclobacillus fastidiosus]WAH43805.1 class I SAM-dependent methyltransferase [Alicyclobacillus fastidiosus]GMA60032.1 tRNA (adenine(22)-N(1))-methyltransferase [Alicyclobacillus fastidiosus]
MQLMTLSKRLQTIVDDIPKAEVLADIGTDHAFIPIHAIQVNRVERAIATDLRSGPLQKARENVAKYGLCDVIDLRLGDGLDALQPGEADVIVSAGIGGHVHTAMLRAGLDVAKAAKRIIFQPMNAGHLLRQSLDELCFHLVEERLVLEDDRVYEILVAEPADRTDPLYDDIRHDARSLAQAYTYGPLLMREKSALYRLRIEREIEKLRSVLHSVEQSDNDAARERAAALLTDIQNLTILVDEGRGEAR